MRGVDQISFGLELNVEWTYSIVKDFLIQTGDRTGTGGGGESFYGGESISKHSILFNFA